MQIGQPCPRTAWAPLSSRGAENCPPTVMLNSPPFLLRRQGSGTWGHGDNGRDFWRAEVSWSTPKSSLCWAPGGLGGLGTWHLMAAEARASPDPRGDLAVSVPWWVHGAALALPSRSFSASLLPRKLFGALVSCLQGVSWTDVWSGLGSQGPRLWGFEEPLTSLQREPLGCGAAVLVTASPQDGAWGGSGQQDLLGCGPGEETGLSEIFRSLALPHLPFPSPTGTLGG